MSDEHHYQGGHELEGVNAGNVFKIIFGLGLVTLLAATAVVQWFYMQREELTLARAAEGSPFLAEHRERVAKDLQGIERVAGRVVEDASVLAAAPRPPGFVDPDGPVTVPSIVPIDTLPTGAPAEGAPAEGAPAEGAPAEGEKAEGAPAEGAPAEGAPAEGAPAEGAPAEGAPAAGEKAPGQEKGDE